MKIPFTFHPRVFEALGQGLVTSNLVAVIELVKNSYDAFAHHVTVTFKTDNLGTIHCIEIEDDGHGMNDATIKNVWCQIATPYKIANKFAQSRRVTGEKGLGRLSAAKLGNSLELITRPKPKSAFRVNVHWPSITKANSIKDCAVDLTDADPALIQSKTGTGTLLRIKALNSSWNTKDLEELRQQLGRLVSPFSEIEDFSISLRTPKFDEETKQFIVPNQFIERKIEAPEYLDDPPYRIEGNVDAKGTLSYEYTYHLPPKSRTEQKEVKIDFLEGPEGNILHNDETGEMLCGPFRFEIRAWDIGADSLTDYAQRMELKHRPAEIKRDLKIHSGISLFRDHILVLPKSDKSRDWLAMDLRRVSRVGSRLSTSQVLGFITTTADNNPLLRDTSDREGLESNAASNQFRRVILEIIRELESQRDKDRVEAFHKEPPFKDLFAQLRDQTILKELTERINAGDKPGKLIPLVKKQADQITKTSEKIEQRVVYYSRLASLGALAGFVVHEVRNQVMSITEAIKSFKLFKDDPTDHTALEYVEKDLPVADRAIAALIAVADRFAPLASRSEKYGDKASTIEDILQSIKTSKKKDLDKYKIEFTWPDGLTKVQVNPGDLFSIIFNLIDNAIYWLHGEKKDSLQIQVRLSKPRNSDRVKVAVHDNGPGVAEGYEERIFWPGITSKPAGLGMGLTVCAELISAYGGRFELNKPGKLGGATFEFDLPLAKEQ